MNNKHVLLITLLCITCPTQVYAGIWNKLVILLGAAATLQQANPAHAGGLTFNERCFPYCADIQFDSYEVPWNELSAETARNLVTHNFAFTECEYTGHERVKKCCRYQLKKGHEKKKMSDPQLTLEVECVDSKKEPSLHEDCLRYASKNAVTSCIAYNKSVNDLKNWASEIPILGHFIKYFRSDKEDL